MEEEVVLKMVGGEEKCNKKCLIDHSDYFKAMFEGNFIERNQSVVKLKDVPLRSMNIILSLLEDRNNVLLIQEEEDALSVLQTSCMLQFDEIKNMCIKRLICILSPTNCVRIWSFAEQLDLKSLCLKAKGIALLQFNFIKNLDIIMDFDLGHLCRYLGHRNLQCKNELDVFQVCMKWWRENSVKLLSDVKNEQMDSFQTEVFMKLLPCLDFKKLGSSDIHEMITDPDLSKNNDVKQILQCIISNNQNDENISYDENVIDKANALYYCRSRCYNQIPCLCTVSSLIERISVPSHGHSTCNATITQVNVKNTMTLLLYDVKENKFRKLLSLPEPNCKVAGWRLLSFKEFIVLITGRNGNRKINIWVYNTITEVWKWKTKMPFDEMVFQSCIVNSTLYIIGATGKSPGVMYWYDFAEDKCSEPISLPCPEPQVKCCSWNDNLFLINIFEKCAYIYNKNEQSWSQMPIINKNKWLKRLTYFSLFSNRDSLYVKAGTLVELKILNQKLIVVNSTPMRSIKFYEIRSIVCDNIAYTVYSSSFNRLSRTATITFEKYCLATGNIEFICEDVVLPVEGDNGSPSRTPCALFGVQYCELMVDDFVNEMCK